MLCIFTPTFSIFDMAVCKAKTRVLAVVYEQFIVKIGVSF